MKFLYDFVEKKLGMDKVAHFLGIALVAVAVALVSSKVETVGVSWTFAFVGFLTAVAVAILKEVFDFFNDRAFDVKDILAGVVGAMVAFLFMGLAM